MLFLYIVIAIKSQDRRFNYLNPLLPTAACLNYPFSSFSSNSFSSSEEPTVFAGKSALKVVEYHRVVSFLSFSSSFS